MIHSLSARLSMKEQKFSKVLKARLWARLIVRESCGRVELQVAGAMPCMPSSDTRPQNARHDRDVLKTSDDGL